jgi:hypothetical protein
MAQHGVQMNNHQLSYLLLQQSVQVLVAELSKALLYIVQPNYASGTM